MAPAELYARARSLFPYFSTATNPAFTENAGGSQVGCGGPGWAQAGALAWRPWPPAGPLSSPAAPSAGARVRDRGDQQLHGQVGGPACCPRAAALPTRDG
jgi:hypothetical protein